MRGDARDRAKLDDLCKTYKKSSHMASVMIHKKDKEKEELREKIRKDQEIKAKKEEEEYGVAPEPKPIPKSTPEPKPIKPDPYVIDMEVWSDMIFDKSKDENTK